MDKSQLQILVEDLERRLKELAGLSPEVLEEAQRILGEAQAALANEDLTAQELTNLLAKVRQALNSLQAGTSADKSQFASSSNKEAESAKEAKNATEVPLYGVLGAAVLSLLGALLFAVARKKSSQLDKLSRELNQLVVELEARNKDKKGLNKAKKLADEARLYVDSQQKDPQKEAELISEIKTVLSQLKEEV
ncbi:surface anchored protein [Streptococcus pneumoniae]|nr:surface anchored protein [Streptococcus pneumoniae]